MKPLDLPTTYDNNYPEQYEKKRTEYINALEERVSKLEEWVRKNNEYTAIQQAAYESGVEQGKLVGKFMERCPCECHDVGGTKCVKCEDKHK